MLKPIDQWFHNQEEPSRSCLLFLRQHILSLNDAITETWQYSMPFYYHHRHRFCYLWVHRKLKQPYLGIVDGKKIDHPNLLQEGRSRMKIWLLDPARDLPVADIDRLLTAILATGK